MNWKTQELTSKNQIDTTLLKIMKKGSSKYRPKDEVDKPPKYRDDEIANRKKLYKKTEEEKQILKERKALINV